MEFLVFEELYVNTKKLKKSFSHINHALQTESYRKLIVAATDTDILTTFLYHYQQYIYEELQELMLLYSQPEMIVKIWYLIQQLQNYLLIFHCQVLVRNV